MNNDLIYRQDAIDALGDEPEVWTDKDEYAQGLSNQWHYDKNAILAVPSAQSKKKLLFSERMQIIELYKEWILRNGAADCAESFLAYLIIAGYIDG